MQVCCPLTCKQVNKLQRSVVCCTGTLNVGNYLILEEILFQISGNSSDISIEIFWKKCAAVDTVMRYVTIGWRQTQQNLPRIT